MGASQEIQIFLYNIIDFGIFVAAFANARVPRSGKFDVSAQNQMVLPLTGFNIFPTYKNDYFLPTSLGLHINVFVFEDADALNDWAADNTCQVHEEELDSNWDCFFVEVAKSEDPQLFGLMLLHRGTLGTSSLVHLSVLAATRFLDKINLSGWVSFDRDVVAETSSTIARQIVDNLYENGVLAYSKREG